MKGERRTPEGAGPGEEAAPGGGDGGGSGTTTDSSASDTWLPRGLGTRSHVPSAKPLTLFQTGFSSIETKSATLSF